MGVGCVQVGSLPTLPLKTTPDWSHVKPYSGTSDFQLWAQGMQGMRWGPAGLVPAAAMIEAAAGGSHTIARAHQSSTLRPPKAQ